MNLERLLTKLEFEAVRTAEKKWREQRLQAIRRRTQPTTKVEQSMKTLHRLRAQTSEIERELDLRHQVEVESQRTLRPE